MRPTVLALLLAASLHAQNVDSVFAAFEKPASPGCALGVIRDGEFIYRKSYGLGSIELGVPLTSQSIFYMGSVSKQFTAASVVLAAEQGLLSLDDNVRKFIPELPDYGHPITLRQMLHHTAGFRDVLSLLELAGRDVAGVHTKAEMIDLIARQKALNNNPGDEYLYSNSNYFLLGEVVARASGMSLAAFAAKNIFEPLGMTHTRFYDDRSVIVPGRVAAYMPGPKVGWSTNFDAVGAGGLMSSVDDLLLWDRNFYHNRLGKGTLIKELQTRGVLNNGQSIDYALGLEISTWRGLPIVEHGGALFGYRTEILRFPEQRFTVLCLCNVANANPASLARKVAEVYLKPHAQDEPAQRQATKALVPITVGPTEYTGTYYSEELDATYRFTVEQGSLVLRINWNPSIKLTPTAPQEFTNEGFGTVKFQPNGLTLDAGRVRAIHFTKGTA